MLPAWMIDQIKRRKNEDELRPLYIDTPHAVRDIPMRGDDYEEEEEVLNAGSGGGPSPPPAPDPMAEAKAQMALEAERTRSLTRKKPQPLRKPLLN